MSNAGIRYTAIGWVVLLALGCASEYETAAPPTPVIAREPIPLAVMTESNTQLANPTDAGWRDVTEYVANTSWAPPVHPSVGLRYDATAPTDPVNFGIARDAERLYVRLRWSDASHNKTNAYDQFADAVAVQFALAGGDATSYTMGGPTMPVNIWYWRASDEHPQDLAAGGFGSTTRLETADLAASGRYVATGPGEWTVVFSRSLAAAAEHQIGLVGADHFDLALAVWQGADGQRDGLKRTTVGWIRVQSNATPAVAHR